MQMLNKIKSVFSSSKNYFTDMSKYTKEELKQKLTPMQYKVTQENGTEPPYKNQYHNTTKKGLYNCLICNLPLFTSQNKFDSGCGWPAFYDELKDANINKKVDNSHGMARTEVRCTKCDSHLGHIFNDGPKDKTGVRYCINSASIQLEEKK